MLCGAKGVKPYCIMLNGVKACNDLNWLMPIGHGYNYLRKESIVATVNKLCYSLHVEI